MTNRINEWIDRSKTWLYPYRPRVRDWRFWAVQLLVLLIAGVHISLEVLRHQGYGIFVGSQPPVALLSFVPVSLFFIPVVYAALNFGFAGSVATALWCTLLTTPNFVLHPGMERVREVFQIGIVDAIAVFVGQRVEREISARQREEAASAAHRVSEVKYRSLFHFSPVAVLLLDPAGTILEANPAAGVLFSKPPGDLQGMPLAELLGTSTAEQLLHLRQSGQAPRNNLALWKRDGAETYLELALTRVSTDRGQAVMQALLRDVTDEQHRQVGLRTYAARMLRAQEEERRRIAQELHDETVQSLVLVCRRLDDLESSDPSVPLKAVNGLRETRGFVERIVEDLRDFARALRPPILEDLGLVTSIRRLLMDLLERTRIEGQVKVVGKERRLPPDVEIGVFRVAQEALRNVERHAQASRVTVTLTFHENGLRLDVLDNGGGFVLPRGQGDFVASGHLGLLGMQERTELLGGSLTLQSSPGKGTRVTISIPVERVVSPGANGHSNPP